MFLPAIGGSGAFGRLVVDLMSLSELDTTYR